MDHPISAESQNESTNQSIDLQVPVTHQGNGTHKAAYRLLRVLFNRQRPDSGVTLTAPSSRHIESDTPRMERTSETSSQDDEVESLRDSLREIKMKLFQAHEDRKKSQSTATSLKKELAKVRTSTESEIRFLERELQELRPLKEEVKTLRDENKQLQTEKDLLENERSELRKLVESLGGELPVVEPSNSTPEAPQYMHVVDFSGNLFKVPKSLYPEDIILPREEFMRDATNGFYRYDRDFLLQFQTKCTSCPV